MPLCYVGRTSFTKVQEQPSKIMPLLSLLKKIEDIASCISRTNRRKSKIEEGAAKN